MFGYCAIATAPISALCYRSSTPIIRTPSERVCEVAAEGRELWVDAELRELLVADCKPRLLTIGSEARGILIGEDPRLAEVPFEARASLLQHGGIVVIPGESRAIKVSSDRRVVYVAADSPREVAVDAEPRTCIVDEEGA